MILLWPLLIHRILVSIDGSALLLPAAVFGDHFHHSHLHFLGRKNTVIRFSLIIFRSSKQPGLFISQFSCLDPFVFTYTTRSSNAAEDTCHHEFPVTWCNCSLLFLQAIVALKKGAHLLKCGKRGKPRFCPFRLSCVSSLFGTTEYYYKIKNFNILHYLHSTITSRNLYNSLKIKII